jgi:glycogen(starch) synthase
MLAATGLVLRALGRVDRVVLWTIDYSPQRFSSRFLNAMYHRIDRLCVRRCDDVWVLSPAMAAARAQRGIARRQRVVPMGSRRIARTGATAGAEIVFVGHLLAKQGVQIVLRALPIVRRSVSDARFTIVGDGPYRSELERLVRELNIVDAVEFTGFLDDHADVERVLAQAAVGVATYDPECASFTAFADPGKVKAYVAAALPVVTTRTHPLAEELEARGCGIVVPYGPEPVAAALALLLSDDELRVRYARNAGTFAREFEWEAVFDRAFA